MQTIQGLLQKKIKKICNISFWSKFYYCNIIRAMMLKHWHTYGSKIGSSSRETHTEENNVGIFHAARQNWLTKRYAMSDRGIYSYLTRWALVWDGCSGSRFLVLLTFESMTRCTSDSAHMAGLLPQQCAICLELSSPRRLGRLASCLLKLSRPILPRFEISFPFPRSMQYSLCVQAPSS